MALSQQVYYVNTLNKNSGTNENFTYSFQIPPNSGFDRCVVLAASIPNSFYLIQSGFNTFSIQENGTNAIITIPPGNYSAKVFGIVVTPLMNAASPNGWTYSISLPNQNLVASTGKFTYAVTGNSSQPSIICTANVNEQLGFAVNSKNTFVAGQLISATTLNFGAESTLFIHSDMADAGDSDILQEIYAGNTQTLSYITYQCSAPEMYSKTLHTNQSSIFRFSLTNEKGQLMILNGVDMQLTVSLYKQDDTNDLIRKYIQYKVHAE